MLKLFGRDFSCIDIEQGVRAGRYVSAEALGIKRRTLVNHKPI